MADVYIEQLQYIGVFSNDIGVFSNDIGRENSLTGARVFLVGDGSLWQFAQKVG